MASLYKPIQITGNKTGLVQSREEFLLPDDAYPILENAYVWRERIRRKQGCSAFGRFTRVFAAGTSIGNSGASPWTFSIFASVTPPIDLISEPNASVQVGSVIITVGANTFTDQGDGTLKRNDGDLTSTINYATSSVTLVLTVGAGTPATLAFNYYPSLPGMGLLPQEINNINDNNTIGFDTKYAYRYIAGWQEFIPGTTWTGTDYNLFWGTNYWVTSANAKVFWTTNFSGVGGDPIRFTDGTSWGDFAPQINAAGDKLHQCLAILPYRSRLLVVNTLEGATLATSTQYFQRIRWAAIGNPFTTVSVAPPISAVNANAWRDDIRGQGGFLDIPTAQPITSMGFVRDNLVIYCSASTWQLRYTGLSVSPFQIERVNSEFGVESTFSSVQFDTALVGVGDKGIVTCDSYQSSLFDQNIPDLVYNINSDDDATTTKRVYGARNFPLRLAYWIYPGQSGNKFAARYPNTRLIFNYENESWATFTDSYTALGTIQSVLQKTWGSVMAPWSDQNYAWNSQPASNPVTAAVNQQGFVSLLDSQVYNDPTLQISGITGNGTAAIDPPTSIYCKDHNLSSGQVIKITGIAGSAYANLNSTNFSIQVIDEDNFYLYQFNTVTNSFDEYYAQKDVNALYIGGGVIQVLDNFRIVSKKFSFLDQGQSIQLGYLDILASSTTNGEITMNIYSNYNDSTPVNTKPQNQDPVTRQPDTFFNTVISTSNPDPGSLAGDKYMQRIFCPVRGNFLTIEYTLSDAQMNSQAQQSDVQIDAQVLWVRPAGRLTNR